MHFNINILFHGTLPIFIIWDDREKYCHRNLGFQWMDEFQIWCVAVYIWGISCKQFWVPSVIDFLYEWWWLPSMPNVMNLLWLYILRLMIPFSIISILNSLQDMKLVLLTVGEGGRTSLMVQNLPSYETIYSLQLDQPSCLANCVPSQVSSI